MAADYAAGSWGGDQGAVAATQFPQEDARAIGQIAVAARLREPRADLDKLRWRSHGKGLHIPAADNWCDVWARNAKGKPLAVNITSALRRPASADPVRLQA